MSVAVFKQMLQESHGIVFFGGAGVSTESGLADFRSEEGIYNTIKHYGHPPETILSRSFFLDYTDVFYRFYKEFMIAKTVQPNKAHLALARLEKQQKLSAVITQNIDNLHQEAGSQRVLELHGSIMRNFCMKCGQHYGLEFISQAQDVPRCTHCGGLVKPDVVLYEEQLDNRILNESIDALANADMLIVGGTSLNVYPAAGLINYFRGRHFVLINHSPTAYDHKAHLVLRDKIGEIMEQGL